MNLARYAPYWAKMRGDAGAAIFKGDTLTWAALDRQANAVAAALQSIGVKPGDRVGCMLDNRAEWVITWTAVFKAGAILVPLNPRYGDAELLEIEAQTRCSVIVTVAAQMARIDQGIPRESADGGEIFLFPRHCTGAPMPFRQAIADGGMPDPVQTTPDDIAVITFTSGSTGLPKGAMLSHRAIEAGTSSMSRAFRWTSGEKILLLAPFAFTGGIISAFAPTYIIGGCIYIEDTPEPERALATIVREKITAMNAVPILWERMAASPDFAGADLRSLRSAVTGGAPVPQSLLKRYLDKGVCIRQAYGCTEASGMISAPNEELAFSRPWTCGPALPTLEWRVVDADNRACAIDETGEILLRGEQMFAGYWDNPGATAEAWSDGWYRTGDLGKLDEMGSLQITDRKKNMVITGGVNVYPAEVERAMSALAGVGEVAAFGVPDPLWGERLVALVHGPDVPDTQVLLGQCRTALGAYKTPKEIIVSRLPLPRTASGKLLRGKLVELYATLSVNQPAAL